MSEGERQLADQTGAFAPVVVDGRKLPDVEWHPGRILLSNRRVILATTGGKRTIRLDRVDDVETRRGGAAARDYLSLQADADVTLLSPDDFDAFERALFGAVLDQRVVFAKHPAVAGGVVQDTGWEKGRLSVEDDAVGLAIASGDFVEVELDDVGSVTQSDQSVRGEERPVIEVEHTEGGTAVQTHLSGTRRDVTVLGSLLRTGEAQNPTDVDLSEAETDVLLALYSGVSPFQIPAFTGMDVDTVESVYETLIEAGLLEKRRTRRAVSLQARGRNIASESMGEE